MNSPHYQPPPSMTGEFGEFKIRLWEKATQGHDPYAQRCVTISKGQVKELEVFMTFGDEDPETHKLKAWLLENLPQFGNEDELHDAVYEQNAQAYYARLSEEARNRSMSVEEVAQEWEQMEEADRTMGDSRP